MTFTAVGASVKASPQDLRTLERPKPPSPLAASIVLGWRAVLKVKHVPEQLFDVIAIPIVFTLMSTYLFGEPSPDPPAGICSTSCPERSSWPTCWSACTQESAQHRHRVASGEERRTVPRPRRPVRLS
jgi:hypothetical protein